MPVCTASRKLMNSRNETGMPVFLSVSKKGRNIALDHRTINNDGDDQADQCK